jgi:MerR family mercuric resistance operon transcriptional regulator
MAIAADTRMTATASRASGGLRVAELAATVGVGSDTNRYYEKDRPAPAAPERTLAGYCIYDPAVVGRLQFIQGAQRLGLTLLDIKNLLAVRDTRRVPMRASRHAAAPAVGRPRCGAGSVDCAP